MGATERLCDMPPAIRVTVRNGRPVEEIDGARSADGKIWGAYFHGLFDSPGFRRSILEEFRPGRRIDGKAGSVGAEADFKDRQYDLLAEHFRSNLNLSKLIEITGVDVDAGNV